MSNETLKPQSVSFSTQHNASDETDSFDSDGRVSVDDQFKKFKNDLKNDKRKWNVFEETGTGDKSVSERRYDKSLQKKYKYLKVFCLTIMIINSVFVCQGFHNGICVHYNTWVWCCEQRGHNIYG